MLPDFGWTELLVISIVLIVVIGPKDLPKILRGFGQTMTSVRRMAGDFRKQFDDALKEVELDEVRKLADDVRSLDPRNQIKDALNPLADVGREIDADMKKALDDVEEPMLPKNPELPKSPPQVGLDEAGAKARAAQAGKRKPKAPAADETAEPVAATTDKPATAAKATKARTTKSKSSAAKPAASKTATKANGSAAKTTKSPAARKPKAKPAAAKSTAGRQRKADDKGAADTTSADGAVGSG